MKKIVMLLGVLFCTVSVANAQDSRGYVGLSLGFAMPTGDLGDVVDPGLELGLINFGYRFTETIGATLNWGGSGHNFTDFDDATIGVGYLSFGPMISFGGFDIKPQYAIITGVIEFIPLEEETIDGAGFVIGTSYNFMISDNIGLSANADYLNFEIEDADQSDAIIKLSAGIKYVF